MAAKRGRTPTYNAEIHAAIIRELDLGCTRTTAADIVGIHRETLRQWAGSAPDWQGKYPAFSADVRAAIGRCKRRASITVTQALQKGDVAAAFKYLSYQERDEWADKPSEVNVTHSGTITLQDAEQIAADTGLDVAEVMAEADRIFKSARARR